MIILTFQDLLDLPIGERVISIHKGIESTYIKVGGLQGSVFLCAYLNGKEGAIQLNENNSKEHFFALNKQIDMQLVKKVILEQIEKQYREKVDVVNNVYKQL